MEFIFKTLLLAVKYKILRKKVINFQNFSLRKFSIEKASSCFKYVQSGNPRCCFMRVVYAKEMDCNQLEVLAQHPKIKNTCLYVSD
jgi:hypothetical protein